MKWKYVAGWCGLCVIAFANGAFRQIAFQDSLGELHAHQLSSALGVILFAFYIRWVITRWKPSSFGETFRIGLLWLVLTVVFEFSMGRLAGREWSALLHDYNLAEGRVWSLVLLWVLVAPSLFYGINRPKPVHA
jgi:hypothetical protein